MFASLLLVSAITAAPALEDGTQLTYRGSLIADKGDPELTRKTFDLNLIVMKELSGVGTKLYWNLHERGRGSWPWPDHFGVWELDKNWQGSSARAPSLLYDRPDGLTVVPIIVPILSTEAPLKKGDAWTEFRLDHHVLDSEQKAGRETWKINVANLYGRKRTLWVEKDTAVVVAMEEVVFIGQGDQYELTLELTSRRQLDANELKTSLAAFGAFAKLRDELRVPPRTAEIKWQPEQLATLRQRLPKLSELSAGSTLSKLVREAEGDTKDQKDRDGALAALKKSIVGEPMPKFQLHGLRREVINSNNLKGSVTVFHFWEYRDSPLREPYGQIGYLDFLNRRFNGKGVTIYGVMVDPRLADLATQGRAKASARKLKSFMNLSYEVLLDAGSVIKQFGDPRVTGAKLPLFVVVDADGKVVHYHTGYYKVDREQGLRELAAVITQALETDE